MSGQLTRSGQVHIPLPPRAPQLLPQQQCALLLQEEVLTLPTLETCHSHWHFCLEAAPHCWSMCRNMAELANCFLGFSDPMFPHLVSLTEFPVPDWKHGGALLLLLLPDSQPLVAKIGAPED
jgi:hypothetical protein